MKNQVSKKIINKINETAGKIGRDVNLMEVCGTHTQAVAQNGIKVILPKNVHLITGPGCPVCVTAQEDIDSIVNIALAGAPVATYGDMLRVPGYFGSLEDARSKGANVFSVYSVDEALELKNQHSNLVFFGLGFETTTPMTAYAIKKGLTVYSTHKLFLPAMKALLNLGEIRIDGFISPGHVSTIIGIDPYKDMKVAQVITGFTGDDVLLGILILLNQIQKGNKKVENEYVRSVREKGNPQAYNLIFDVFEEGDGNWRGFGIIPNSGLNIKEEFKNFDAKVKYKDIISKVDFSKSKKPTACKCGEIIRGLKSPRDCPMFGKICTPEKPFGPCMVSFEGSCNVEYRYK